MMLLAKEAFGAALRTVFTLYGAFWIVVGLVLFFGVGALLRKRDRTLEQRRHAGH